MNRLLIWTMVALVGGIGLLDVALMAAEKEKEEAKQVVEITADKLHLRTGLGTNFPAIMVLKKDDKLVVLREKSDWLEVKLPPNAPCWISKKMVEVKEENKALVKDKSVNVRFASGLGSTNIIGQVTQGQSLTIIGEEGEWYKIEPPDNLTGWVNKKYTKYWGDKDKYDIWFKEQQDKILKANKLEVELKSLFEEAEQIYTAEKVKPNMEQDFSKAISNYKRVAAESGDKTLVKTSKERLRDLEWKQALLDEYRDVIGKMQKADKETEEQYRKRIKDIYENIVQSKRPTYDAYGWMDYVGKIYNRPAAHKLVKGGQLIYYLLSGDNEKINLDDYFRSYVAVRGKIIENKGRFEGTKTIIVEEIKVLGEGEIIEE